MFAQSSVMVISIHALREEGDLLLHGRFSAIGISIHALREEGDPDELTWGPDPMRISIHALREEGDRSTRLIPLPGGYFYPRPPRGGRLEEERDRREREFISIHALREEGDPAAAPHGLFVNLFLSTPSARRATSARGSRFVWLAYFYPRPPRGGRLVFIEPVYDLLPISIHALREEGDDQQTDRGQQGAGFLSTPSARRATRQVVKQEPLPAHFYPRPPRGGRLFVLFGRLALGCISIHALREEGDVIFICFISCKDIFLSTPSARRATARMITAHRPSLPFLSTPSARRATPHHGPPLQTTFYFYPRPPRGGRPCRPSYSP